jgi:hypothetical protein
VSRLFDRVPRRALPGLDTNLSGLGVGFTYPVNVRVYCNAFNTPAIVLDVGILDAAFV